VCVLLHAEGWIVEVLALQSLEPLPSHGECWTTSAELHSLQVG
jgi:hypothetical protein